MKNAVKLYLAILFGVLLMPALAAAQTSVFTYQGKLTDGGAAASGQYDFTFRLFDAASDGTQISTDAVRDDVQVSGGIFTVNLDFGAAAFSNGAARFLEISVRAGASTGAFTLLTPRQEITSAPFAIRSKDSDTLDGLDSTFFWSSVNDGFGSGLDADLLDGLNSLQFLRSDASGTLNGTLSVNTIFTSPGTVTAPAYSFAGDTNTGMYSGGADTLNFATGGTLQMQISNSGARVPGVLTTGSADTILTNANGTVKNSALEAPASYSFITGNIDNVGAGVTNFSFFKFIVPANATLQGVQVFCTSANGTVSVSVTENGTQVMNSVTPVASNVVSGAIIDSSLAPGSLVSFEVTTDVVGSVSNLQVTLVLKFNHQPQ